MIKLNNTTCSLLNIKLVLLYLRTDQLLELFEDAPNEQDAWGATVDAQEKLYSTDSDDSDTSSSSDERNGAGSDRRDGIDRHKEGRKEWQRSRKHRGRKFKVDCLAETVHMKQWSIELYGIAIFGMVRSKTLGLHWKFETR